MSPKATRIEEEGVYIDPFKLVARGRFREDERAQLLTGGPYPARNPEQNIADLKAQVAANEKGAAELRIMVAPLRARRRARLYGPCSGQCRRERAPRDRRGSRLRTFEVETDQGNVIKVAIKIDRKARKAAVDFTGTSAAARRQFQRARAGHARRRALRVPHHGRRADIPMNAGCLKPIKIVVPKGSMLKPRYPAAVVAGNVETSQTIDQLPVRRARRARLGARHDEQSHLRQRALPVLRDDLLGRAGRSRLRRRRRACTRT